MTNSIATYPPLIIIEHIMQYASFIPKSQITYRWKSKLPLLAVCRSWRKHGLRWIYRYAFYNDMDDADNKIAKTNIRLISDSQYSRFTTNLLIHLDNQICLARFLEDYKKIFKFDTTSWLFITNFDFIINDRSTIPDRFTEGNPSDVKYCYFADFSKNAVQYMPRITHLNIEYKDDSSIGKLANTTLFNAYCHQLEFFQCYYVTSFVPTQCFDNLTGLEINLNPETEHLLPAIDCSKLVTVFLKDIPYKFSWNYFCHDSSKSKKVIFSSLVTLSLIYIYEPHEFNRFLPDEDENEEAAESIEEFVVEFPILDNITIINTVGEPLLRSSYKFPKKLSNINMFNSFNVLDSLANSGIEAVNTVTLQFSSIEIDEENNFYEYTNWLFGPNNIDGSGSLRVHNCNFGLDWERVKWTNLTSLDFTKCNVKTLTTILYYCTKLICLSIWEIILEGTSDDLYSITSINIGDASFMTMKPRDNMKYFEIRQVRDIEDTFDHAVILFQTLMCLFRNLKRIGVCEQLIKPLKIYAERYRDDYSHFVKLKVEASNHLVHKPQYTGL